MTTIVSAYVDIKKPKGQWTREKYLERGKLLLEMDVPKVVFLEETVIKQFGAAYLAALPKTAIVPYKKEQLLLNELVAEGASVELPKPPPRETEPSLDYLSIQINKTEWVRQAVAINPHDTAQFMWIDFGIYHIFKDPAIFKECVLNCQNKAYDNVRIAGIWGLNRVMSEYQIRNTPLWFFAGGVFGGDKDKLLVFADKLKEKTREVIKKGYVMWEVNLWYLVCLENRELFDSYSSDHNLSILSNY